MIKKWIKQVKRKDERFDLYSSEVYNLDDLIPSFYQHLIINIQ